MNLTLLIRKNNLNYEKKLSIQGHIVYFINCLFCNNINELI
jgi:hypothetical protein